jgi:putative membrane protein
MKRILIALGVAVSLAAFGQGRPDYKDTPTVERSKNEPLTLKSDDLKLISKLHHTNQMEVSMGKIAKERGSSKKVKSFGELLIKDHSNADKELSTFASTRGIDIPEYKPATDEEKQEAQKHATLMDKLQKLNGAEFDREFATAMVDGHTKAINDVETTRGVTQDSKFESFLGKLLPVLKEHKRIAEKIAHGESAS